MTQPSRHITLPYGWQIALYDVAGSTSDILLQDSTLTEGMAVLARQQTKGRGRQGRYWQSEPDDGMYLSVALQPNRPRQEWPTLSFVAALSLLQALEGLCPSLPLGLKWPNDVLTRDKKLSGLLLEAQGDFVILGCGVNLKNAPHVPDMIFPPTDVEAETGVTLAPEKVANAFLSRLQAHYQNWQQAGFSAHYSLYKQHLLFQGAPITVRQTHGTLEGVLVDVAIDGTLSLQLDDGTIQPITTGDVNVMGQSHASRD